ncbi:hypothetical protein OM076_11340 [Solirubrobacter ginsenosidimutans]|uniref:Uncharacterized protein n=1 Tax=Solirubrobacter ginsenosidimutans TaxID=490573 RepID=A0A9X3RZF8_9ACTN|nr:hypothetical protein [Solirubrobacter ginsenosidimutans]MDA0160860.1 hypothetical protein [Solirubrobacter ginsenosidimutans]
MNPFAAGQLDQVKVGNDAGWLLSFRQQDGNGVKGSSELELSSTDYYASIDATLSEGLSRGAYRIVIENLTEADHAKIAPKKDQRPLAIKLYLYWRDVNSDPLSYLTNLIGANAAPKGEQLDQSLVAVLSILSVARRAGARAYETEITAVEAAFAGLTQRVRPAMTATNFPDALKQIQKQTGVEFATWGTIGSRMTKDVGEQPGDESVALAEGLLYREGVERMARALELNLEQYGRGMLLIRDGTVHVGKRPIPYPDGDAQTLMLASGLLSVTASGQDVSDPFAVPTLGDKPSPRPLTYTLTLKGRPDLKPGHVVAFEPPYPEDGPTTPSFGAALAGAFAAPLLPALGADPAKLVKAYVTSVRHTLSRTAGFVTLVSAISVPGTGDDAWDKRVDGSSQPVVPAPAASSDPGVRAAEAVRLAARMARGETRVIEVGEVRAAVTDATGKVEPPAQTEKVFEGLAAGDGRARGARRLEPRRKQPSVLEGVPYLSPFAWGKTGLVVPRYPGMRVALGYRNGQLDDMVDLGALWTSGRGPISKAGDWWLSLPVDVPADRRASIPDQATPAEHTGKVTNDLTDAEGSRVIEVGDLTVRVGKPGLKNAGTRPEPAEMGTVTIEHTGQHAKIVMRQDGTILISGKGITLDAGDAGTITMKAKKVDVHVKDAMEVGD